MASLFSDDQTVQMCQYFAYEQGEFYMVQYMMKRVFRYIITALIYRDSETILGRVLYICILNKWMCKVSIRGCVYFIKISFKKDYRLILSQLEQTAKLYSLK